MSSAIGNLKKSGPPKYQNKSAFKNNLHDKSQRTKQLNALEIEGTCSRCKEVIEWKIRYRKYKTLSVPKKCTVCSQKNVKRAYYIMCDVCQRATDRCAKCGKSDETVTASGPSPAEKLRLRVEFERDMNSLTERQRRTFFRLQAQGKLSADASPLEVKDEEGDEGDSDASDRDSDCEQSDPDNT